MTMGVRNRLEDAWRFVDRSDPVGCWWWRGTIDGDGYGRFCFAGQNRIAHRIIYELATRTAPGELLVCHTCDERRCCNPAHLFLGTPADNMRDMVAKGREPSGERSGMARLRTRDMREIRQRLAEGVARSELATRFGVTKTTIGHIARRVTWRHV